MAAEDTRRKQHKIYENMLVIVIIACLIVNVLLSTSNRHSPSFGRHDYIS